MAGVCKKNDIGVESVKYLFKARALLIPAVYILKYDMQWFYEFENLEGPKFPGDLQYVNISLDSL